MATVLQAHAAGEFRAIGSRFMVPGLGGVSTIGIYNPVSNQAGMAFQKDAAVSLYYANTSIAAGVNNFQAMGMMPLKKGGALGLSLSYFGYNLFNDKKAGLSYALKLAEFVSIGAQLDVLNTSIAGYGTRTSATFQLGTIFKVTDHINLGAHVYNPLRIKFNSETEERIPTVFRIGATYHRNEKFWITAELEQDLDLPLAFRAGIDYKVNEILFIRAGILSLPLAGTAGAGLVFGSFRMELTGAWQPITGFSPHIGMSYVFN
jgi:long-subunit fatty acid transport protein